MKELRLTLVFGSPGYIAEPYWPEMNTLVDIQKKSGINRAKSDDGRNKALSAYLDKIGMTRAEYDAMEIQARRPFHTDSEGQVIIPSMRFIDCLTNAAYIAPSAVRICKGDSVRSVLQASDFLTGKTEADGKFERYVRPQGAGGKALSNQRGLRTSLFIEHFEATGLVYYDPDSIKEKALMQFVQYTGKWIGIGASRKMGYGRFIVK